MNAAALIDSNRRRALLGAGSVSALAAVTAVSATLAGTLSISSANAAGNDFAFAFIGDIPYSELEFVRTQELLAAIDNDCDFVIHVGDIKSGTDSCADEAFERRFQLLRSSPRPLIYVPGDNDWSDCLRTAAGGFLPYERLAFLRKSLFNPPGPLAKAGVQIASQAQLEANAAEVEHLRWLHQAVLFLTVNRPGGVDLRQFSNDESELYNQMIAAGERWLRAGFALAQRLRLKAVVIASHANPGFENDDDRWLPRRRRDMHRSYRHTLADLSSQFNGQVLFLHGDTHRFQVNQPLRDRHGDEVSNFTRVECFGSPFSSSWVRIRVSPVAQPTFQIAVRHLDKARPY